jgi:hypothetical protein
MSHQGNARALMRCVPHGYIDATMEEHLFALVFASFELRGKTVRGSGLEFG